MGEICMKYCDLSFIPMILGGIVWVVFRRKDNTLKTIGQIVFLIGLVWFVIGITLISMRDYKESGRGSNNEVAIAQASEEMGFFDDASFPYEFQFPSTWRIVGSYLSPSPPGPFVAIGTLEKTNPQFAPQIMCQTNDIEDDMDLASHLKLQRKLQDPAGRFNVIRENCRTVNGLQICETEQTLFLNKIGQTSQQLIKVIKKDNKEYSIMCAAAEQNFPKYREIFETVIASFTVK